MAGPTPAPSGGPSMSFWAQLKSFSGIYWISNWMELIERYAYYGVRTVLPVFMVLSLEQGGPEFNHLQKADCYAVWALVQSFVPIFSGGFADKYGYKVNIALSTALKIVGYLLMGFCIPIAEAVAGTDLVTARGAGTDITFEVFFIGAMFLAFGTAIFKPGVQGLIANQLPDSKTAALGWSLFYQAVNIGGFVGPLIGGYLRIISWDWVFVSCSIAIALNFIPLFFFKEPERPAAKDDVTVRQLLYKAVHGLLEARLFFFTMAFAGFWLMFYQLFDILPNFIDDWVDSRGIATFLGDIFGAGNVPTTNGGNLVQEWMINFNPLLISFFAFAIGYMTGKVTSLGAITVGIIIAAVGIFFLGTMDGWFILGAIAIFSFGEMAASPTKMRYLSSIAPPGQQGQYMGYANMTTGIGWSIGSIVAGSLYQYGADKTNLARTYLVQNEGASFWDVASVPKNDMLGVFEQTVGVDAWGTRQLLWDTYEPQSMWLIFALIGLGSLAVLLVYTYFVRQADKNPDHAMNTRGRFLVQCALVPMFLIFAVASFIQPSLGIYGWAILLFLMLIVAFTAKDEAPSGATPNAEAGSA